MRSKIIAGLILVCLSILLSACSEPEQSGIIGDWQAYGIKTEDGIEAYSNLFDKDTAKVLNSDMLSFKDGGTVRLENKDNNVSLDGTYEKENDKYLVKFVIKQPDIEEQMEVELKNDEGILIVRQIVPDGYENTDPGELIVYKRAN